MHHYQNMHHYLKCVLCLLTKITKTRDKKLLILINSIYMVLGFHLVFSTIEIESPVSQFSGESDRNYSHSEGCYFPFLQFQ